MTAAARSEPNAGSRCWCCDHTFDESQVVRLGSHPEVAVCLECARFLQRRARERHDALRPSVAAQVRSRVRAGRETVVERGWHTRPVLGPFLRRLDRFLP
jgi:hypothetical protein